MKTIKGTINSIPALDVVDCKSCITFELSRPRGSVTVYAIIANVSQKTLDAIKGSKGAEISVIGFPLEKKKFMAVEVML